MSTVLPPPPPSAPPSGGSLPANSATLVTQSPEVAALARGASIEGVVQAILAKNQIQVQTVLGTFALQTTTKVPLNSVISLVVSQLQPQQILQITSLNGTPVAGSAVGGSANPLNAGSSATGAPQAPGITTGTTTGTTTGSGAPTPGSSIAPGVQTSATLLRPANTISQPLSGGQPAANPTAQAATPTTTGATGQIAGQATPQAGGATAAGASGAKAVSQAGAGLAPNTTTGPKIAGNAVPSPVSGTPGSPTQTQQPTGGASAAGGGTTTGGVNVSSNASAGAGNAVLPSGTRFNASIVKVDVPASTPITQSAPSPGTNTSAVLMLARGTVVAGTVTGLTSSGQPIIQLPSATIALDVLGQVATGSRITIEITGDAQPPKQTTAANALMRAGGHETFIKSNNWNSLNEALKAIEISDPGRFNQIMQNVMPQVGSKLSSQILFFLSALRSGDVRSWLGDTPARLIERERPGLLGRVGSEFQAMGKLADNPSSGDWRMAMIPLYHEGRVDRIRLYQRRARDKDKGSESGKRFVLDFDLSKLGHIQIDGLVKSDDSRVDVIVRTEKPLGRKEQMEISQIYNEAAELTGIGGGIAFQSSPGNFIEFPSITEDAGNDRLFV